MSTSSSSSALFKKQDHRQSTFQMQRTTSTRAVVPSSSLLNSSSVVLPAAMIGLGPGAVGGVCNILTGHPIDLVKVRMQTSSSSSSSSTSSMLKSIFRTQGIAGLYAGVSAPLVAVVPAFAITFWSYEWAKSKIMTNNDEDDLTLRQLTMAGGVSGFFLGLVVAPTERIKCLMQVNNNSLNSTSFMDTVKTCYNAGGIRSLFRGTALTVLRDVPGNAAYFGTYEAIRRTLLFTTTTTDSSTTTTSAKASTIAVTLLAGGLAGVANWIVAIPVDTIKSRWQTNDTYNTVRHCCHELLHTQGVPGLFRGLGPAMLRAFPANAACLLGVETARSCIHRFHLNSSNDVSPLYR